MTVTPGSSGIADSAAALSAGARALLARRARFAETKDVLAIQRSPVSGRPAPLSSWQQSIWFFDQMEPGNDVYNRTKRIRLSGPLDLAVLEASIADIFRKHEVLRSRVVIENGNPAQRVMSEYEFRLPVIDLRALSPADRAAQSLALTNVEARAPFDLEAGPWARATLVREAEDVHVLLFTAHHIAFDGWSASLFATELAKSYARFAESPGADRDELAFQYGDFATWERGRLDGSALDEGLDYWVASLRGAPPLLELPADHPRPAHRGNTAGMASVVIPAAVVDRLHALGREENATLFMTVLAAFQLLLVRLSGQDDVVVGIPVAGRGSVAVENMIGCFINVLPLRARMTDRCSFRDLLRDARKSALEGLAHQECPFDAIVDRIQPERTLAYTPLTQVLFNFRNTPSEISQIEGLRIDIESVPAASVISDLEVDVEQDGGALRISATYNAALFNASTVDRWLGHFLTLLDSLIAAPEADALLIPMQSDAERRRVTVEWNSAATAPDYETCLHQLIEAQVRRTPDATAVRGESATLSYAELDRRANMLAHDLVTRGVVPGVLVGVNIERSPDLVVALLAVLKAGAAYVPLDPEYPADRIAYMLGDSRPAVLLTRRAHIAHLDGGDVPMVFVDAAYWDQNQSSPCGDVSSDVTPDGIAYVIYTSGSTGRPKGAMNTHRAVCNMLLRNRDTIGFCTDDVALLLTPVSFDQSVNELFLPLVTGGQVALARPNDAVEPESLAGTIETHGVTTLFVVPTILQLLVEVPDASRLCRSIRAVSSGGEVLSHTLLQKVFATLDASVFNAYGPSETAVDALVWQCERGDQRYSIPIGRPLVNNRVYILDTRGGPVPIGVQGEIYLGGVCVGRGYLNRPDLTAEKFLPDPFVMKNGAKMYRTGDLARFDEDGVVEIRGRADHQVKLRGVRIELGEIESVLCSVGGVRESVVVMRDNESGDPGLVAYVVAEAGITLSERELLDALRARLLPAMVPSAFVMLDSFPLTPSRKVDRHALPAPVAREVSATTDRVAPRTPTERSITAIWVSLLKHEDIGIDDDFFGLGGHSLNATRVMSRIHEEFGVRASPRLLFDSPTIRALSTAVDNLLMATQSDDRLAALLKQIEASPAGGAETPG